MGRFLFFLYVLLYQFGGDLAHGPALFGGSGFEFSVQYFGQSQCELFDLVFLLQSNLLFMGKKTGCAESASPLHPASGLPCRENAYPIKNSFIGLCQDIFLAL
jgi:hypothetical protein